MHQILHPGWWLSYFPQAAGWWFFCVLASIAALPLCMRAFRGLADRGASLSIGVGLIATTYLSWLLSLEWFTGGAKPAILRLLEVFVGCGLLLVAHFATRAFPLEGNARKAAYFPAAALIFCGLVPIPFGPLSAWLGLLILAAASVLSWIAHPGRLAVELRRNIVPFILTHIVFLIAFLFFANVRSYIPYATFEISLFQAEKWGNMTHLNSVMTSTFMPPKDIWFNGEPVNYYYGGHLFTGTIARATFTRSEIAFNLGLATIFALTMSMGFGFMLSLVHFTTRKFRLPARLTWHSGIAWALFGACAIGMFGNLDAFRQLFTREVDWGVKVRWERARQSEQQEWKLRTGVPVSYGVRAYGATVTPNPADRGYSLLSELQRLASESAGAGGLAEQAEQLATRVEQEAARTEKAPGISMRQRQDAVSAVIFNPQATTTYEYLSSINATKFAEELYALMVKNDFATIAARLREASKEHKSFAETLGALEQRVRNRMEEVATGPEAREVAEALAAYAAAEPAGDAFGKPATQFREAYDAAMATKDHRAIAAELVDTQASFAKAKSPTAAERRVSTAIAAALPVLRFNPAAILNQEWGGQPPSIPTDVNIKSMRFSWENATFIDFWAPSRAIKGTPPGKKDAGTITEFPYFSAILGDHHPHHAAIPFSLAALCACLSLLRKNARGRYSDARFFLRSWPDLLAMAFFMGAVFPVNIWDAVVLSPLYGVTILVAYRGVLPNAHWRWVGFAGFLVLLALVVGLLYNSMPGVAPLFQNFKFFLLAVAILFVGLPLAPFILPRRKPLLLISIVVAVAALAIFAGALTAPGAGGANPQGKLGIAVRDLVVFSLLAGIVTSWTLGDTPDWHRWWYGAGAVYLIVGGLSLLVILPFQLFFHAPLTPQTKILYDALPPFMSYDLISAKGDFWAAFWRGSPVNPFPAELRTDLRDFFVHWGIFLIPIMAFMVVRFVKLNRESRNGESFLAAMCFFGVVVFARNYLRYWAGALSLGFVVLSLFFAFNNRRRSDGPIWAFLSVAFFWTWFVEGLHFDDDYGGDLERYNTPFKIYYPLWAIFAGGMVVGLREMLGRFRVAERNASGLLRAPEFWAMLGLGGILVPVLLKGIFPAALASFWYIIFWIFALAVLILAAISVYGKTETYAGRIAAVEASRAMANWPGFAVGAVVFAIGMYYPVAATMTRTHDFFTWPMADSFDSRLPQRDLYAVRTLDALEHMKYFDDGPQKFRQDYKAMKWMKANIPVGVRILERADDVAYSQVGRMSTGSAHVTILGWKHHEHQWRGRAKPAPIELKGRYASEITTLNDLNGPFEVILGKGASAVTPEIQRQLRFAGDKKRLEILRGIFPKATLMQLYRLRREVELNDIDMQKVGDRMLTDAQDMYRSGDKARVQKLFADYDLEYVVVGELERQAFGADVGDRFKSWGFTVEYDSSKDVIPEDQEPVKNPTIVLKTPPDFLAGGSR